MVTPRRMPSASTLLNNLAGQVGEGVGEPRRIIQRVGAGQAHAQFLGELLEADINVVEHFDVIAQKTDGLDEDGIVAVLFEAENLVFDRRAEPWASGHTLTLECEGPVFG